MCMFFALKCDAFTSTIFHIFFPCSGTEPASLPHRWLVSLVLFPPRLPPAGLPSKASSLQPAGDYEEERARGATQLAGCRSLVSGGGFRKWFAMCV